MDIGETVWVKNKDAKVSRSWINAKITSKVT